MLIHTRFAGHCRKCAATIKVGDLVDWERGKRGAVCAACAQVVAGLPMEPWVAVLDAAEEAIVERATQTGMDAELQAAWDKYQKMKMLALRGGTPGEARTALRMALISVIKQVV